MTTADGYIDRVLDSPRGTPLREQIALELRGHIAERLAGGQTDDESCGYSAIPCTLAESYLAAVPLVSARSGRALAKVVDIAHRWRGRAAAGVVGDVARCRRTSRRRR